MWTMPLSGLLAESRLSRTSDSACRESPGNSGRSKITDSYRRRSTLASGAFAIVPFHREVLRITVRAQDAHGFERDFGSSLRRKQLGHSGFQIASFAAIPLFGCRIDQEARGFDPGRHICQFVLDGLILCNW